MLTAQNSVGNPFEKVCRPILFVEADLLRLYPSFFRSTLVGLISSTGRPALAGPFQSDFYKVLCPTIEVFEYPRFWQIWKHGRGMRCFWEALQQYRPTVLHGVWPAHARLLNFLSHQIGVPYVLSFFEFPTGIRRLIYPFEGAAALLAASEPITESLRHSGSKGDRQIYTVRPGCYVEDTCACFAEPNRLPSLVSVHPLNKAEEVEPFLQALRHLRLDGFEFFAAILGSGRAEHTVRRRIQMLGLSSIMSVVPIEESIHDVLCGADIFVYLRTQKRYDPLLLEVMGAGLAVAGAADPIGQLLQDGRTAVLFDPDDELSIYAALKKLLSRPEWARHLALAAQDYVRRNHPVSGMIEHLVKIYLSVQNLNP